MAQPLKGNRGYSAHNVNHLYARTVDRESERAESLVVVSLLLPLLFGGGLERSPGCKLLRLDDGQWKHITTYMKASALQKGKYVFWISFLVKRNEWMNGRVGAWNLWPWTTGIQEREKSFIHETNRTPGK